jgi:hypothetical protein
MKGIRILVVALFCAPALIAQTNRGGISGTVLDTNGAAIPGATVTVTNLGTNQKLTLRTSDAGAYSATSLDPVTYSVTVEAAGFRKAVVENVKVDTATTVSVNVTLEPGAVGEEVTVTSEAPLINAESGTAAQTITERQIVEMPLNNRSVLSLAITAANVTGDVGTEDPELGSDIPSPGFNLNVNGGRAGSTAILADGANNTGVGLGRAVVTFSPDTVQEFTVQTSNFSAEFGQTGGGVINMTTKSGTNSYNGLLYWYHRNPALNAAPFTTATVNRPQANRRQHQFGLTYSGPVQIPKIYDGHNKTFFFVAFEPRYYYDSTPSNSLLPTEAMRRGDFSNLVNVPGGFTTLDIAQRFGLQSTPVTIHRQFDLMPGNQFRRIALQPGASFPAFPGNIIPQAYLDSLSQDLLKYLPTPGDYFLDTDGSLRNYATSTFIKNLEQRLTVRIDHQLTEKNRLTGRYTQVPIRGDRGRGDFQVGRDEVNASGTDYSWSKQFLLTNTHTFSSSVINELRLNYTYGRFTRNLPPMFDAITGRNFSTEIGLPSLTKGGLPEIVTGGGTIGWSQSQQNENAEHSYEIADNISWVRGNQTWKFGTLLLQQRLKTIPMFGAVGGRYEFNRNTTLTNSNGGGTGTGGNVFAQFLLGVYNQATLREVLIPYYYQWNTAAFFVQNDWKVRPNLTLNLGLRYSLQLPRTEKYDRQGMFLPELAREFPLPAPVTLPNGRVITSALVPPFGFVGRGGRSRYMTPVDKMGFEPRFGFAWVPKLFGLNASGKLVMRGGYGISHVPLTGTNRNPSPDFASGTVTFGTFDTRVENPSTGGVQIPARICCNRPVIRPLSPEQALNIPEDGLVYLNSINIAAGAVAPNSRVPYVQSWSTSLAYELPQQTVVELSYSGSKGTHLYLPPININPVPFDLAEAYFSRGLDVATDVNDPLGRRNASGGIVQYSQGFIGTRFMGFENLFQAFDSSANSIRHAGTISVRRRHSQGLSYTVNYTFGKSIDEASDSGGVRFVDFNIRSPGHVNFGAPRSVDRSVSTFDVKHAFSASFLWDVPLGRGRAFLSDAPKVVEQLLGGWSLSGIGRIQGGLPLTVVLRDGNRLADGNQRAIRPDVVPGVPLINPRYDRNCPVGLNCEPWFNPAAFMRPPKGQLGNAPRTFDNARYPTQHFLDLALQKNFPLGGDGKRRLQLRVDLINALNHPVFRFARDSDNGEIFAAPNEALISNAEYDAWRNFDPANRPARTTPQGQALLTQINNIIINGRIPGTQTLRPDFFSVRLPEGFHSIDLNSYDITTPEGLKLYRMRQAYTPDRWAGLLGTRAPYTPRFVQFALKLYF